MRSVLLVWILSFFLCAAAPVRADTQAVTCKLPYVYFDLGADTLINTSTYDFKKIFFMPGAFEYLKDLKAKGYHLGLLVNVPESWGATQQQKIDTLRKFIEPVWTDTHPMDWSIFDLGVQFPPTDAQRKPQPYLFDQAVRMANAGHCDAVYEGTLEDEIPAANRAGMIGIQLGKELYDGGYYYPEARLRVRDFSLLSR